MEFVTSLKISAEDLKAKVFRPHCGAVCSFEGVVRDHHQGKTVIKIIYEAYGPMAEKTLAQLKKEIEGEWPSCAVAVKHRVGELHVGDVAVAIVVWSPHRAEAFAACHALIDRIKKRTPIWKKEFYADGRHEWVECGL